MSSFRKALKSQQRNHHERSQVNVLPLLFTTTLPERNCMFKCIFCLCFCSSRLSGRIWACWRRRRTTDFVQSKIRYVFTFVPTHCLHPKIRTAVISAGFVVPQ